MSAAFLLGPPCPELAPGGLCRGKAPRGQLLARGPAALPQAPRWGWLGAGSPAVKRRSKALGGSLGASLLHPLGLGGRC